MTTKINYVIGDESVPVEDITGIDYAFGFVQLQMRGGERREYRLGNAIAAAQEYNLITAVMKAAGIEVKGLS